MLQNVPAFCTGSWPWRRRCCCWAACPLPALGLHAQAEEISSTQKLRVGYYAYTGFNMIDADGSYSGYSYELLQKIARYRNVIYEYDGYDGDVNDVMQMLEDGEIDVIPNLRITPDREDRFDFTTSPVGTIASMLTVRARQPHRHCRGVQHLQRHDGGLLPRRQRPQPELY